MQKLSTQHSALSTLWQRGTDFLGTKYAIMGGAMSWVSERHLVAALSNAGAFGVIACSSMSPERLEEEIIETRKLLKFTSPGRGEVAERSDAGGGKSFSALTPS